jgi:hypothetical protein
MLPLRRRRKTIKIDTSRRKVSLFLPASAMRVRPRLTRCSWPHSGSGADSVTPPGWLYAGSKGRNTAPHLPSLYAAVSRYSQGKIRHLLCFPAAAEELPPARTTPTKR